MFVTGLTLLHRIKDLEKRKLSCRRNAARRFVSLNISLSHSKSFKVIKDSIMRKLGYGFLFAFRSNSRFDTIHERDGHQTPHDGTCQRH